MSVRVGDVARPLPAILVSNNTSYRCKAFLGKGGFARCYLVAEVQSGKQFAVKAIAKRDIKDGGVKLKGELVINRSIQHVHIARMFKYFEDPSNVYMLLEFCSNKSLMELMARRNFVTEPEARYFLKQITEAVAYLHDKLIVHRDIKLGNIMLNGDMLIKLVDFGLAVQLVDKAQRRLTICGTPNYIAPEILHRRAHSFEVDVWALGCILYYLLAGHAPFQMKTANATYERIKKNDYQPLNGVSVHAKELIQKLLHPEFEARPTAKQVLTDSFFQEGLILTHLPVSSLTTAPKFVENGARELLESFVCNRTFLVQPKSAICSDTVVLKARNEETKIMNANLLDLLKQQLNALFSQLQNDQKIGCGIDLVSNVDVEAESPNLAPVYWVNRWVDYSGKYGLTYQLSDNAIGIALDNGTKVMVDNERKIGTFTNSNMQEFYFDYVKPPSSYSKFVRILKFMDEYMAKELAIATTPHKPGNELARPPTMNSWYRDENAIVMLLSTGTLQVNFINDHVKFILCPHLHALTILFEHTMRTYSFATVSDLGCSVDMCRRLYFIGNAIDRLRKQMSQRGSSLKA